MFHLLYRTSVKGRRDLSKHILDPDGKFKIDSSYTSRVAEIFNVILKSLGVELVFQDEDKLIKEYDDKKLREYEYEGTTYLCTEWEFFKLMRKKQIELDILSKVGIIDADELEKKVLEVLENENYLIK